MTPSAGGLVENFVHSIDFSEVEKRVLAHMADEMLEQAKRPRFITPTARVSFPSLRRPTKSVAEQAYSFSVFGESEEPWDKDWDPG